MPLSEQELIAKQAKLERIRLAAREQVAKDRPQPEVLVRKAKDVASERLETAFSGRLIRGAFQLMVGPGESGKGMCSVDMVARLSKGEPFPDEDPVWRRQPVTTVICVTEDSASRVKARLCAAGADLTRVYFVDGPPAMRGGLVVPSPVAFDSDAGSLLKEIKKLDAGAIFLETTVEHLGDREGKKQWSTNNEAEVRRALAPLVTLCREAKLLGWGVMHPRKTQEGGIEDSISGSAAFRNIGRTVMHVYRDPEDQDEKSPWRLLVTSKSNYLHTRPHTLRFRIEPWDQDKNEGRVVWGTQGKSLIDSRGAEHIWRQIQEKSKKRRDYGTIDCEHDLLEFLKAGARDLTDIHKMADDKGYSWRMMETAKHNLGVESVKDKGFPARVTQWRMPQDEDEI